MFALLLTFSALLLEGLAVIYLLAGDALGLLWHLLASLLLTPAFWLWLPYRYQSPWWAGMSGSFAFALFLPVLGMIAMLLVVLPALYWRMHIDHQPYAEVGEPELPFRPLPITDQPVYGEAGMVGILRHAADSDKRQRAVMATRQMEDKVAIPVLREALRDPVDDVRLLAYSMLDRKEERLNQQLKALSGQLEEALEDREIANLHQRLADVYWEFAYLGIAQGDVLRHALQQAQQHLLKALEIDKEDPGLYFQLGRVSLRLQAWDSALQAFKTAETMGLPRQHLLAYKAEIAFERRNFAQVKAYMQELGESGRKSEQLEKLVAYWR